MFSHYSKAMNPQRMLDICEQYRQDFVSGLQGDPEGFCSHYNNLALLIETKGLPDNLMEKARTLQTDMRILGANVLPEEYAARFREAEVRSD